MELITFKIILVLALFLLALTIAAYSTWAERKVAAVMQDRIGPSKAGPFGLLQPLADGGKFFFKEDFTPANAEKFLFILGPSLVMFISLITGAVIPWGKSLNIGGTSFDLQVANIDVGVLYIIGMASIGVYGIMIGGWASNNKYDLGVKFIKKAGVTYPASGKLVRDRERGTFDYMGVLHRSCWYDPQPDMVTNIDNKYDGITLQFENQYHTADDLWRRTKQTVEIYASNNGEAMGSDAIADGLVAKLQTLIASRQNIANPISNSAAYNPEKY